MAKTALTVAGGARRTARAVRSRGRGRQGAVVVQARFEKFTERAIKAVMLAQLEAHTMQSKEVGPIHLLIGLGAENLNKEAGYLGTGVTVDAMREAAVKVGAGLNMEKLEAGTRRGKDVPFDATVKGVFDLAIEESKKMGVSFVAPEHILLALLNNRFRDVEEILSLVDTTEGILREEALKKIQGEKESEGGSSQPPVGQTVSRKGGAGGKGGDSVLEKFATDLTAAVRSGKIDPVIGRDKETDRVIQILGRRTKNNPILLGEAGVGKTAVAECLAQRIVAEAVPDYLMGKRVMSLDVGLLMAGAKERGELEQRITKLVDELKNDKSVMVMIDEVHILVGGMGGGKSGGLDISNMIKPALARGELQCIGATTLDEHRKYFEGDKALERRFQPVRIEEPTVEQAHDILEGLSTRYEAHHRCIYTPEALETAVNLSSRYINDRYLPDKAIDLMDEAGSRVHIDAYLKRKKGNEEDSSAERDARLEEAQSMWEELKQVMAAKQENIENALYEEAALMRDREAELRASILTAERSTSSIDEVIPVVTEENMQQITSSWTGIPVEMLGRSDKSRLARLEDDLLQAVIGQEDAVRVISQAMRRAGAGIQDPGRPLGSMFFAGPTGVGKTELAKSLARTYFGSERSIVRFDMSEYMERHSVAKLIGSPPGYVGFGEGGLLTEAVRRKPFCLILLDEVEKAHPDVFNLLLQVLEDGRLKDSKGKLVNFKNTLIVMTSNVGSHVIEKGGKSMGFGFDLAEPEEETSYQRIREMVMDELRLVYRPEFLNRIDEIVTFRQLGEEQLNVIAGNMLAETADRLKRERNIQLLMSQNAMKRILAEGFDPSYGARPLRRAIMRLVEDTLSEAVLSGSLCDGDTAIVELNEESKEVCISVCKPGEECDSECLVDIPAISYEDAGAPSSSTVGDSGPDMNVSALSA